VQELLEGDGGLWIGWSVPREVALTHHALVGEQLGDALVALSQVFAQVVDPVLPRQRPGLQRRVKRAPVKTVKAKAVNGAKAPIDRGAKVLVLAGPFVGKEGVVQELDGRGAAKVMLGLLATRLDVTDLAIAGDGKSRPVLSSSHRKPLAAR